MSVGTASGSTVPHDSDGNAIDSVKGQGVHSQAVADKAALEIQVQILQEMREIKTLLQCILNGD